MAPVDGRPLVLAHRGDHRQVTENTLAAFRAAMAVPGCDGVELDVRSSADGIAVVLHDESLVRTLDRPARAADLPAAALGPLGVPSLAEALAALPPRAFVDVELKEDVVEATVAAIRAARPHAPASIVLSSFYDAVLASARRLVPAWPCWLNAIDLAQGTIDRALELGCAGIAAEWHALSVVSVGRAREAGLDVAAWTVTRRSTAADLARLGIVAMCAEGEALGPVA